METPKIKLLIPIEIKYGCELPDKMKFLQSESHSVELIVDNDRRIDAYYDFDTKCFRRCDEDRIMILSSKSYWIKEVETDLTIDELKKIGVLKD